MDKLRAFVSSVQLELENERVSVQHLLQSDQFLQTHCVPVLYEYEPASPEVASEECLTTIDECQIYVLIVWKEYGHRVNGLSIIHKEYRRAKEKGLPVLAFVKGLGSIDREEGTQELLAELKADGYKHKHFGNVIELQREVRAALVKLLSKQFSIEPTSDEDQIAKQTIEATSPFESQPLDHVPWEFLDQNVARQLIGASEGKPTDDLTPEEVLAGVALRGLVWRDPDSREYRATAAGVVLLGRDPSAVFPHCRILADAYRGADPDGDPRDHEDIRGPMPMVVDRAVDFIDRNTRHPMRIVGLSRVRLDEYPVEALREALVNALAHRNYEDAGRKIMLEVFADRVVVSSPGFPPSPITLAKLRRGNYKPCSRNPVIAQWLSYFHRIEERGSGFQRMRDSMLDHGLDRPTLGTNTGYFQIVFPGPGEDLDRLRVPPSALGPIVTPAVEAQLNERQKKMTARLVQGEELTSRLCEQEFSVTRDAANRDFKLLMELDIAERRGGGRSTRYVLRGSR